MKKKILKAQTSAQKTFIEHKQRETETDANRAPAAARTTATEQQDASSAISLCVHKVAAAAHAELCHLLKARVAH